MAQESLMICEQCRLEPLRVLHQSNLFGIPADFLISCEQNERLE